MHSRPKQVTVRGYTIADALLMGAGTWPLAIGVALVAVNVPLVYHYLGATATEVYLLFYLILSVWTWRFLPGERIQKLALVAIVLVSLTAQIISLHLLSPQFDNRMDRDSALTTWLTVLGRREYPYAAQTDLGNPISVFPFMPILSLPFYLLGNVGYLQIFAYLVLAGLLWNTYQRAPRARVFSICVLSSAPLLFFEVIGRSDLIANMALLILLIHWLEMHEEHQWGLEACLLGGLLGCLGATRLALFPVLTILVLYMARTLPRGTMTKVGITAIIAFGALVVPFAVWDPRTFFQYAPLGVNSAKLGKRAADQLGWLLVTGVVALMSGLAVNRVRQLYAALVFVLLLITLATWLTFSRDLTYLQLIFVSLLFTLSRSEIQDTRGIYAS